MTLPFIVDDYDVEGFLPVIESFRLDPFEYVVTPNVDHLIRYHDDPAFRALYADAAYVLLDSRFLAGLLRTLRGIRVRVCTGSDLTAAVFSRVLAPADRVVLIGGSEQQAALLAERYGLQGLRHYNPPMGFIQDPQQVEECLRFAEAHSPFRFCLIAVGAPQQEILAQKLKSRGIAQGLGLCVGASVNFLTGAERRAPRWMQRIGMEWFYRLLNDPYRLAQRYLVRGPRVFALLRLTDVQVRSRTRRATPTPESVTQT